MCMQTIAFPQEGLPDKFRNSVSYLHAMECHINREYLVRKHPFRCCRSSRDRLLPSLVAGLTRSLDPCVSNFISIQSVMYIFDLLD
jgi:hypothetical protein